MCDVMTMTIRINNVSKCGFNNRLKLTTPDEITNLRNFNRKINNLVADTYDVFEEIGPKEWEVLKDPFEVLTNTTKDLIKAFRKRYPNHKECETLERRLSCLIELQSDITRFRLDSPLKNKMIEILNRIEQPLPHD